MFEVEAYCRRDGRGGIQLIADRDVDDAIDELCELRVRFRIDAIYPPEKDTGAGMDWDGDIDTIQMRTPEIPRLRRLRDEEFVAAKTFLLAEHGDALWQAGYDHAEAVHFGEA